MFIHHRFIILCALVGLSFPVKAFEFSLHNKMTQYALCGLSVVSATAFLYQFVAKKSVEKNYEALKKRFKNQTFIQENYDQAVTTTAHFKQYAEIVQEVAEAEVKAQEICNLLLAQYAKNNTLLLRFKQSVEEQLSALLQKNKEIEHAFNGWQDSKKKTLLIAQGPLVKKAFNHAIETLETLRTHIPYIESVLFLQNDGLFLKDEQEFSKYLSNNEQLPFMVAQLVRSKTRIGERYPYRTYTKTLEVQHEHLTTLEHELTQNTYFAFQEQVIASIKDLSKTVEVLKKYLKASKEFEAECAHFDAEVLAIAHQKETETLKEKLSNRKLELELLNNQTEAH